MHAFSTLLLWNISVKGLKKVHLESSQDTTDCNGLWLKCSCFPRIFSWHTHGCQRCRRPWELHLLPFLIFQAFFQLIQVCSKCPTFKQTEAWTLLLSRELILVFWRCWWKSPAGVLLLTYQKYTNWRKVQNFLLAFASYARAFELFWGFLCVVSACLCRNACCSTLWRRKLLVCRQRFLSIAARRWSWRERTPVSLIWNHCVTSQVADSLLWMFFRVFVNRSLHLEKIKFFGFDMDYTLAGNLPLIVHHLFSLDTLRYACCIQGFAFLRYFAFVGWICMYVKQFQSISGSVNLLNKKLVGCTKREAWSLLKVRTAPTTVFAETRVPLPFFLLLLWDRSECIQEQGMKPKIDKKLLLDRDTFLEKVVRNMIFPHKTVIFSQGFYF